MEKPDESDYFNSEKKKKELSRHRSQKVFHFILETHNNPPKFVVAKIAKMSRRGDGAYARNPPLSSRRQADTRKRSSGWALIRGMILKMVNKLIGSAKRRSIISKICQDLSARKIPYF